MRPSAPILAVFLCAACGTPDVVLRGKANDHAGDKSGPLAAGELILFDQDQQEHDRSTTGADGRFEVLAPEGELVFVQVDHPQGAPAYFTGQAGLDPVQDVPDDTWYGVPDWQRAGWEATFDGCEGIGDGGLVIGQVHAFVPGIEVGPDTVVTAARVGILRSSVEEDRIEACYLNDDGVFDPEATRTGDSGMYAVPEVPPGRHMLLIEIEFAEGLFSPNSYTVWMPADGVAPRFPSLVELPMGR